MLALVRLFATHYGYGASYAMTATLRQLRYDDYAMTTILVIVGSDITTRWPATLASIYTIGCSYYDTMSCEATLFVYAPWCPG